MYVCIYSQETVQVIVTSPVLSPTILADLDVLNALLYDTIMAVMSVNPDADFGVEEAGRNSNRNSNSNSIALH